MHSHGTELDAEGNVVDNTKIGRISRNKEWLPLGAALTEHVNNWAGSRDLVLYIGDDGAAALGEGAATAFYDPRTREIEISAPFAFGPGIAAWKIDVEKAKTKKGLVDYPVLGGLLLHESMHSKHSTWGMDVLLKSLVSKYGPNKGQQIHKIYVLLEETRIESRGVREWPKDVGFLRASARKLAQPPASAGSEDLNLTTTALLVLGRGPIGVLTKRDLSKLRRAVIAQMDRDAEPGTMSGADTLAKIEEYSAIFHKTNDNTPEGQEVLMGMANEVYKLLVPFMPQVSVPWDGFGEKPEPQEDGEEGTSDGEGEGEDDGEGDGTPQEQVGSPDGKASSGQMVSGTENNGQLSDEAAEAAEEAMDSAELGGAEDVWNEEAKAEAERQAKEAERQAKDQQENERKSNNTFERSSGQNGKTKSKVASRRQPTDVERRSMVTFNAALEDAKYRDRAMGIREDYVPPGRLRTSGAMRDEAVRWSGGVGGRVTMFKGKRRTHVDQPDLTVGIIKDISGSMSGTMEQMAVADWVLANSVNRIEGSTVASLCFGESVFPTLWPGDKLEQVTKYSANDGFEEFNAAFQSIDGKLKLLDGDGVRLLVIVSDGNYRTHEEKACKKWLAECQRAGVGVLWLGLKHGCAQSFIDEMGPGGEFVSVGDGVTEAIDAISAAALRALRGY